MVALDFPNNPQFGNTFTGPNGVTGVGDGQKWTAGGGAGGGPVAGDFLPLAGGTMLGQIDMDGNQIVNLASPPIMPNGAASAQWVLDEIAATSLYQGTWNATANMPNLGSSAVRKNDFMWIVVTSDPANDPFTVPATPSMPGLNGNQIFTGDHVVWSSVQNQFGIIRSADGGSRVDINPSPPVSPAPGMLWWDAPGAQLYVWTGSQWVIAVNPGSGDGAGGGGGVDWGLGVTNGSDAAPGRIGEYIVGSNGTSAGVPLPLQAPHGQDPSVITWSAAAQINLTAGDWDVSGNAAFSQPTSPGPAGTFISTECQALLHTSTAVGSDRDATWPQAWVFQPMVWNGTQWQDNPDVSIGIMRYSSATPFTVYVLMAVVGYDTGGVPPPAAQATGWGTVMARRMR